MYVCKTKPEFLIYRWDSLSVSKSPDAIFLPLIVDGEKERIDGPASAGDGSFFFITCFLLFFLLFFPTSIHSLPLSSVFLFLLLYTASSVFLLSLVFFFVELNR